MKYQYTTVKGKIEIEVDEQLYDILDSLDREERNSDRRYNRHNPISLGNADFIEEWMDERADVLGDLIHAEDRERFYMAFAQLTLDQRRLIERIYLDNEKIVDIAQALGVSQQAISSRLMIIRKKLKEILQTALYF